MSFRGRKDVGFCLSAGSLADVTHLTSQAITAGVRVTPTFLVRALSGAVRAQTLYVRDAGFEQILSSAQSGDEDGYAALWNQYAARVAAFLRSRGSREPEDLTSEVFLAAFRGLEGFRGDEAAFRGYLFTIAHRRLVDELRRRSRRPAEVEWTGDGAGTADSAESEVLAAAGDEFARELLDSLSPDQRAVLVLRIFGDLSQDQIAAVVGKRVGAVKALQRRGVEALRKKVGRERIPVAALDDVRSRDEQ